MPRITEEVPYDGVLQKIERLGLTSLVQEVRNALEGFTLLIEEGKNVNGAAAIREMVDDAFRNINHLPANVPDGERWKMTKTGAVDWTKCHRVDGTRVCVGVEVQVSGRSAMLAVDIIHLRDAVATGNLDVCIIIVPDDELARHITDRAPTLTEAKHHVNKSRSEDLPILILAFRHDGVGPRLVKKVTNMGKGRSSPAAE